MNDADVLYQPPPVETVEANLQRGNEAMDRVLTLHVDVLNAMQRPEVTEGPISFYWGNKGGGVLHILNKHGEKAARMMPEVIAKGEVQAPFVTDQGRSRRTIVHGDWMASLSLERHGNRDVWLLTGFDKSEKGAPDVSGRSHKTDQSYTSRPFVDRDGSGAGAAGNMAPAPPGSNPHGMPHGTKLTSGIDPADVWRYLGKPALDRAKPPVETVEANLQRGNEAMDRVLTLHVDVLNAMQRPEVTEGPISFYWGNKGGGVLHILKGHGEEAVRMMPEIIAKGEVQAPFTTPRGRQRRNIVYGDWVASLSLERFGKHEVWLVTGFAKNAPVASADPHMNRAELRSPGLSSLPEEGAGAADNMAPAPPGGNPHGMPHGTKLTSGIDPADVWRHLGKPALSRAKCAVSAILAQCHNARPLWVSLTVAPSPAPTATA